MSEVNVTIAGRSYRMACEDGQEQHLRGLADLVDQRIADMRVRFGEIGDLRLTVMGAIVVADELAEARRRLAALEGDVAALQQADGERAAVLEAAASRIEAMAARLLARADAVGGAGAGDEAALD
ncbi:MAG TPA: cell division protein ZapA [Hyphomicrobiales bacterium]|nr:cell division protein ZapA [Hyphomicrobiales bacterium]